MQTKMVILPKKGQLAKNGGMFGPIETPHMTDIEDIRLMLLYGEEVFEVLEDGSKVKLTEDNYNTVNTQGTMVNTSSTEKDNTESTEEKNVEEPVIQETQENVQNDQEMLKVASVQKNSRRK